jgi:sodium bicarbonate transporter 10
VGFWKSLTIQESSHISLSMITQLYISGFNNGCDIYFRWIKFEEDVEEGGNRWSKPHVATLSLHSLFELRSLLLNNIVMLDMEANSLDQIADMILDNMISAGHLDATGRDKVREALLRRHRHLHNKQKNTGSNSSSNMSRLPIIRSLAEIGKSHSSSKSKSVVLYNHTFQYTSLAL